MLKTKQAELRDRISEAPIDCSRECLRRAGALQLNGKRVKKYKTPVKMSELNPYYNQSFKIEVSPLLSRCRMSLDKWCPSQMQPYDAQKTEFHIYVMDCKPPLLPLTNQK